MGQPHPFEAASLGVACSSAATAAALKTTSRRAPTRATSTRTGRPPEDDRCRPTCSPALTDCGQQYPVTTSRPMLPTLPARREQGRQQLSVVGEVGLVLEREPLGPLTLTFDDECR